DLEGALARVHVVVAPVDELDLHVDDRVAGKHPGTHRLDDSGVDRGDVLLRDLAADDLVDELVARPGLLGKEVDLDVAVLARAACLAAEPPANLLGRLPDSI